MIIALQAKGSRSRAKGVEAKRSKKFSIKDSTITGDKVISQTPCVAQTEDMRGQAYWTIIRMTINLMPSGGRRYMAQEGTTKLLNPELEEPTA